jgi:GDP-D-mannose 3',5'-epimerase
MKRILVCGAGGFIGHNLVKRLVLEGNHVTGIDRKLPEFEKTIANVFLQDDLAITDMSAAVYRKTYDEVYQLAAEMGGAGYVFTGNNDAGIMRTSVLCNLNILEWAKHSCPGIIFFSSSACAYPQELQTETGANSLKEDMVYPANPDSNYGWEKIFSERLYQAYANNHGLNIRIARFHNIYGPQGAYQGGREKAPAAMCRKVALAKNGDSVEIWGNGEQMRSFLYIDDCLAGVQALMNSNHTEPVNIGSAECISINNLVNMVADIAGKQINIVHIPGPVGVNGRNSDNTTMTKVTDWTPTYSLVDGLTPTYNWINCQLTK